MSQAYPGFQSRQGLVAEVPQCGLGAVKLLGKDQTWLLIEEAEILRHHANDLLRLSVHADLPADHRDVAAKPALPVSVGQNRGVRTSGAIVRGVEPAPEQRLHPQRIQSSLGHGQALHLLRRGQSGDTHAASSPDAELLHRAILIAKREIVRWRSIQVLNSEPGCGLPDAHQPFGIGIR